MIARLRSERRRLLIAGLHLGALWAFAFAQPLFEVLTDNAAFFAIRGSEPIDIVLFAVGLVLIPPLVLMAAETLATAAAAGAGWALHLLFVAALIALFALQAVERPLDDAGSTLLIPIALAVGAAAAAAYAAAPSVRSVVTVVSPAPLLFLVLFLFFSPITKLVFPSEDTARVAGLPARHPVVMITLDQFPLPSLLGRDGRVDAVRYPHFAELADGSHWFRNTAATSDLTELALPAILTGTRPAPSDLPILQDHPRNVFTLLGGSHELHVTESVTHLCPRALCRVRRPGFTARMDSLLSDLRVVGLRMVLPSDLDDELPSVAGRWQGFDDDEDDLAGRATALDPGQRVADLRALQDRRELFERFVRSIDADPGGRPPFYFVHLLLPHFPFEYLPSGRGYGNSNLIVGLDDELNWTDDPAAVERAYQRHVLQVGFVDRELGRLVRRLRSTGMYDRSLIVVTADHGATFRAGEPLLGWGARNVQDMLPVPLFIKAPGQRHGKTVDSHLQTIDIVPTIADLLDAKIPWKLDGHSGLAPSADRRAGLLHHPRDDPRPFSFRTFDRELRRAVRRKLALFGEGPPDAIYRVGPRRELLGRLVSDLPAAAPEGLRATLDRPELFDVVPARSLFVPAHVTAELDGPRADVPQTVAVAVNGRIEAVARTVPGTGSGGARLSAILPEDSFRDGANRVQLLAVSAEGSRVALAPLAETRPPRVRFRLADGQIRPLGQRPIRIVPAAVEGFVGRTEAAGDEIRFSGWAVRREDGHRVERILVFAEGQFALATEPDVERPDVASRFETTPDRLGFSFALPLELGKHSEVETYAVVGGAASRVPYLCGPGVPQVVGC